MNTPVKRLKPFRNSRGETFQAYIWAYTRLELSVQISLPSLKFSKISQSKVGIRVPIRNLATFGDNIEFAED